MISHGGNGGVLNVATIGSVTEAAIALRVAQIRFKTLGMTEGGKNDGSFNSGCYGNLVQIGGS